MYGHVPIGSLNSSASRSGNASWRDRPKSTSTAVPSARISTLLGLMSRWIDVLPVQVVQRRCDAGADLGDFVQGQRRLVGARGQAGGLDALHHDVGLVREVAARDVARHVWSAQGRQDHLLDLEADDRRRVLAGPQARDLHQQRPAIERRARHAATGRPCRLVRAGLELKAVDHVARPQRTSPAPREGSRRATRLRRQCHR